MLVASALQVMRYTCVPFVTFSILILLQQSVFGQETTASTNASGEGQYPSVSSLIREAKFNTEEQSILSLRGVTDYTYKWRRVIRRTKDDGTTEEKSETYEVYLPRYWGKRMKGQKILIEKNGRHESSEKVAKKRLKARKKMEKKNRSSGFYAFNQGPVPWGHFAAWKRGMWSGARAVGFDAQKVFRYCDMEIQETEKVAGRDMIVMNFSGCSNFFYNQFKDQFKVTPQLEGKLWIDEKDRVFARIAVWPKGMKIDNRSGDYVFKNAPMVFGSTRVDEGFWFWNIGRINCRMVSDLCYPMTDDTTVEVFDYTSLK
jgi:hypothetical protein